MLLGYDLRKGKGNEGKRGKCCPGIRKGKHFPAGKSFFFVDRKVEKNTFL